MPTSPQPSVLSSTSYYKLYIRIGDHKAGEILYFGKEYHTLASLYGELRRIEQNPPEFLRDQTIHVAEVSVATRDIPRSIVKNVLDDQEKTIV